MGDGYSNPVVGAGGDLIRAAIRSIGYKLGLTGWTINQDGSAEFNNVTVRGLVLAAIFRSLNYVAGVSGFELNGTTGAAELNNLVARGSFSTGFPGQTRVEIVDTGINGNKINMYSDEPTEIEPAMLSAFDLDPSVTLSSADWDNEGRVFLTLTSPYPGLGNPSQVSLASDFSADTRVIFPFKFFLRLGQTNGVTLASTGHAFQIGDDDTLANMAFDRNTIQARNNGAAAALELNQLGGGYTSPDMQGDTGIDAGALSTASTSFVALGSSATATIPCPPSGAVLVTVCGDCANSVAANAGDLGFQIQNLNSGGAVLFSATAGNSARITGSARNSGAMAMKVSGLSPASGTLFGRAMFASDNAGNTASFRRVHFTMTPLP